MITSKYITQIIAVIMVLAVLFTGAAMALKKSDSVTSTVTQPEYVSRIFDKDAVLDINIEIAEDDWNWLIENAINEEYRPCNITVNGDTYKYVGIRPKGNSSLTQVYRDDTTDRFSFKLSFGKYIKGQTLYGLSTIALNNVMSDATYMKEYISYDLMAEMGVPSPVYTYADIKVNGEPWGLYLAVEIIDRSFLERYFGTGNYNLYKPEPMDMAGGGEFSKMREMQQNLHNNMGNQPNQNNQSNQNNQGNQDNQNKWNNWNAPNTRGSRQLYNNVQNAGNAAGVMRPGNAADGMRRGEPGRMGGMGASGGSNLKYTDDNPESYSVIRNGAVLKTTGDTDFKKVVSMIKALDSGENLEKYLNVEEVLRYFAVNTFLVNLDSYSGGMYHNYYLLEDNGIFQILPWDFNLSFAGFGMQDAQRAVNFPIDTPTTDSLENAPLIGKLLEVPEYKELYHKYLQEIVVNYIKSGKFQQTISKLNTLISNYVKNDATAFYTYEQYQASLPVLAQFASDRTASIKAQLSGEQLSDSYGSINTTVNLQTLGGMGGMGDGGAARGPQGAMPGQIPGMNADQPAMKGNWPGMNEDPNNNNLNNSSREYHLIIMLCLISLAGGIMFAWKFKRKKYN
ncbi:MAG TPA: CotH kinase family protein [Clostridiales bacterium]|nr:CotH kinase family protein [Clostridiales bacterium]